MNITKTTEYKPFWKAKASTSQANQQPSILVSQLKDRMKVQRTTFAGGEPNTKVKDNGMVNFIPNATHLNRDDDMFRHPLKDGSYLIDSNKTDRQLPVIAALLPSMVMNEVGIVQSLDRRSGRIYYWDVTAGTTKGSITAGDTLMGAKTGHITSEAGRTYGSAYVPGESLGTDSGVHTNDATSEQYFVGTLHYTAPFLSSVIIKSGTGEVLFDATLNSSISDSATLTIDNGRVNGYITTGGQFALDVDSSQNAAGINISYRYNYENATEDGVPEMNINLTDTPIEAIDFPLRTKFTLRAALDLEKAHGLNKTGPLHSNMYRKVA